MNFNSENMVLFQLLTSQKKQNRKKRTRLFILFFQTVRIFLENYEFCLLIEDIIFSRKFYLFTLTCRGHNSSTQRNILATITSSDILFTIFIILIISFYPCYQFFFIQFELYTMVNTCHSLL